ncbi:uncharacterized protein LOC121384023 isoform X2 [Gigantopelta aegis]|uniref:uncharacterized protein LOC121384023 isoform X2 n=1 Tax=Gigantopelta aegis TaxID=1735272 RepID=UPI001B888A03|nr:uncharacterized protein LOC121384023 isoform X2 [Gigantopelta aegis]
MDVTGNDFRRNIAYHKKAWQSSVAFNATADLAVDGNTTTNWIGGSCTSTALSDPSPWWVVDLGKSYNISEVIVSNRGDCCGERLHDFSIELFLVDPTTNAENGIVCAKESGAVPNGFTIKYPCVPGTSGRYLRIHKTKVLSAKDVLTLCEVYVVGIPYSQRCPEGFFSEDDNCYYVSNNTANWLNASMQCQAMGSSLAIPATYDEDADLSKQLFKTAKPGDLYWLGAKEQGSSGGKWKTANTGHEGLEYTNWEHEETNNCVVMSQPVEFKWEIKPCGGSYHFICRTSLQKSM